eukprot:2604319-Pyramimonas_sp.AAC.1
MGRVMVLAGTHPLASALDFQLKSEYENRVADERGRASHGDQSDFTLCISLAVSGKMFHVGLSRRNIKDDLFGVWWMPRGENRTDVEYGCAAGVLRRHGAGFVEYPPDRGGS